MSLREPTTNSSRLHIHTMAWLVFLVLFLYHINPIGLSDIYWHLNTGRWIWEHGALPDSDPFTFTLVDSSQGLLALSYLQRLILQGYWLAQLLFYGFFVVFDLWGLVVLKAALFVTLYVLVWRTMVRAGVEPLLGLLAILILPWLLYRYDELRPQIFTFIGVVLVYMNMSYALIRLRNEVTATGTLIALPIIMLLWANLHPGYILGWVIILVMLAGASFNQWRDNRILDHRAFQRLFFWCVIALLASLINPLTSAFIANIGVLRAPFSLDIDEFLPLYSYARMYNLPFLFYGVLALALTTLGLLIHRRHQTEPAQAFLFIGFTVAGFYAFRFMIFLVLVALMIGIPHASALSERYLAKYRTLLLALLIAGMAGVGYLTFQHSAWKQGPVQTTYVPERAADWILEKRPPGPLFNAYEYGGYLGWRLTPEYRMFVDPRGLSFDAYNAYQAARGGHYREVFEKYGVNSAIFYILTPILDSIPEVTLYMLMDQQWVLVYVDRLSVVLVRRELNTLPVIDKTPLLNYLQNMLEQTLTTTPDNTQALVQYGRVLLYRGDVAGARQHFSSALKINPRLRAARRYLEELDRNQQ